MRNSQFALQNKSGFDLIEAAFLCHDNACQLEGSDHGGRDSAAGLALVGTIDVQASDSSCNRLTLGPTRPTQKNYTPDIDSVNEFFDRVTGCQLIALAAGTLSTANANFFRSLTLLSVISILPFLNHATAR